ncbi:hypothetical protein RB653_007203 [Dictyostelium firmibasis]|uniref:Signal peptidase complex subunit 2 n=1 Tax=Dictyostelium firmibasis TaxID=79012 RepID=A0AAN7YXA5_9MYCE
MTTTTTTTTTATTEKPTQVTLYDSNTIKQTLDDSVVKYVTSTLSYSQNQKLNYTKVFFGVIGCSLAAIAQFYPIPFPKNKPVLILCVALYIVISLILYYINIFIQKDYILQASKNDDEIKVATVLQKYDPNYQVKIENAKNPSVNVPFTKSIDLYFDTKGTFLESNFHNDLSVQFKKFSKLSVKDK